MSRIQIHLGPYAKCPVKTLGVGAYYRSCGSCNREISASVDSRFCDKCGVLLEVKSRTIQRSVSPYDVLERRENLACVEVDSKFHTFIANKRGPLDIDTNSDCTHIVNIAALEPDHHIEMDLKWFRSFFSEDLELLKEAYGEIETSWGLVTYYL